MKRRQYVLIFKSYMLTFKTKDGVGSTMFSGRNAGLKWSATILCAAALLPVLGCGGSSDVSAVEGVVTLDGEPVPHATVEFTPIGEGRPSTGRTDENGHYELAYTATQTGAKIGEHKVTIMTGGMKSDASGDLVAVPETIPAQYNEQTHLVVEVTSGANTHDFALKSE